MKSRCTRLLALVLAAFTWPAAALQVDPAASRFTATFQQMGVKVEAPFREVTATVSYDPAQPEQAQAEVVVAVKSFDLGDAMYNAEVMKPVWFDAAAHPQATFRTERIERRGDDLVAHGTLTIKGHAEAVSVPLTVAPADGGWRFDGEFTISRLAFDIGSGEWRDTSLVADPVLIRFAVVAAE